MTHSHLDWFAATIQTPATYLLQALDQALPECDRRDLKRGRNGFTYGVEYVERETEERIVHVDHGGQNPMPHLSASGKHATRARAVLAAAGLVARVTRVDSALDFHGATVFDDLVQLILQRRAAPTFRGTLPAINQQGDWIHSQARTLYLGRRQSRVMIRLYEKTAEQLAHGAVDVPSDWVRLELEYKPDGDERFTAATLDSDEIWGASGWTRDLWAALHEGELLAELWREVPEPSTLARATSALLRQYSATMATLRDQKGDDAFCAWLLAQLDEHQRVHERG